jgi:hypothetical protein
METVFMRSPDGEVKEVEATTEALTPRMGVRLASGSRAGGGAEAGSCG